MADLENIDEWIEQAIRDERCSLRFGEAVRKRFFDMGGLNDAWALECDQIKAKLAAAEHNEEVLQKRLDVQSRCLTEQTDRLILAHGLLREACRGRFEHGEWISWVQNAQKEISSERQSAS